MAKARHGLYSQTAGKIGGTDLSHRGGSAHAQTIIRSGHRTSNSNTPAQILQRDKFRQSQLLCASGTSATLWKGFGRSTGKKYDLSSGRKWIISNLIDDGSNRAVWPNSVPFHVLGPVAIPVYTTFFSVTLDRLTVYISSSMTSDLWAPSDLAHIVIFRQDTPGVPFYWSTLLTHNYLDHVHLYTPSGTTPGYYILVIWYEHTLPSGKVIFSPVETKRCEVV